MSGPGRVRRFRVHVPWLHIYGVLALLFLYLPLFMVVLFSFNSGASTRFPIQSLTLSWYERALSSEVVLAAVRNSIVVGLGTTVLTAILGTMAALGTVRRRFVGQRYLTGLFMLPLTVPLLIFAVALLTLLSAAGIRLSLWTVVLGHSVALVPYVFAVVRARLQDMDRFVDEAARDLGANAWRAFWAVTFPLIRSAILGAMFLVFALSIDMFVITLFTIGPQSTLPLVVFGMLRRGIDPSLNAISTLLLMLTAIVLIVTSRFARVRVGP